MGGPDRLAHPWRQFVIVSPCVGHRLDVCFNPEWGGADVK